MTFSYRKTHDIDINELSNILNNTTLCNPSQIRIKGLKNKHAIDIGCICFTKRRLSKGSNNIYGYRTIQSSLVKDRYAFTLGVLNYIHHKHLLKYSIYTQYRFIKYIILMTSWCDKNQINTLSELEDTNQIILMLTGYSLHIKERINNNSITADSAHRIQQSALEFFEYLNPEIPYTQEIQRKKLYIKGYHGDIIHKSPPINDIELNRLYADLFYQIGRLLIKFEKTPYKLSLEHGDYWLIPSAKTMHTVSTKYIPAKNSHSPHFFDYKNGAVIDSKTPVNLQHKDTFKNDSYRINILKKNIKSSNIDQYHTSRIYISNFAINAFVMMFSVNTAMNESQILKLKWTDDEYTCKRSKSNNKQFIVTKPRAKYKEFSFEIESTFKQIFDNYIKLRRHILDGLNKDTDMLFFNYSKESFSPAKLNQFNRYLKNSLDVKHVSTVGMNRVGKGSYVAKKHGIIEAANIINNSHETFKKSYLNGNNVEYVQEMTQCYDYITQIVSDNSGRQSSRTPIGQCGDMLNPAQRNVKQDTPDCSNFIGCLFCDKYSIHPDPIDYKKLLSLKYVIYECKHYCDNDDHFNSLYQNAINVINLIELEIKNLNIIDKNTIKKINSEVFEQKDISPYWLNILHLFDGASDAIK